MTYQLPNLPYKYSDLEPEIDAATMKTHHNGHHKTYCDKLNETLKNYPNLQKKPAEDLLKNLQEIPEEIRQKVINFGGGYVNHNFFFSILQKGKKPKGKILNAINESFESFEKFKEEFKNSALALFGSGYTWLVADKENNLKILNTKNQDSPLSNGQKPILTIDMWEHAYYLKHQNKKADYIEDFFNIINWDKVEEFLPT